MESKSLDQIILAKIVKAENERTLLENDSPRDLERRNILDAYINDLKEELKQVQSKKRGRRNSNFVPLLKLCEINKNDSNGDTPR